MEAACKINIGTFYQTVFFSDGLRERESIPLDSLPTFFAKEKDINKVYLSGGPKNLLQSIEKQTKEKQILFNNKNDITFIYSQI